MTTLVCDLEDCIHNNRRNKLCKCTVLGINGGKCDSYFKTPKELEEALRNNDMSTPKINWNLKRRIVRKFGNQAEFSMKIKQDETVISAVIRNRRKISKEIQKEWADVLECKVEDIFDVL